MEGPRNTNVTTSDATANANPTATTSRQAIATAVGPIPEIASWSARRAEQSARPIPTAAHTLPSAAPWQRDADQVGFEQSE